MAVQVVIGGSTQTSSVTSCVFHIVVENVGGAAITVSDVGLRAEATGREITVDQLRRRGETVIGPDLPYRCEGLDQREWEVETVNLKELEESELLRSFIRTPGARRSLRQFVRRQPRSAYQLVTATSPEFALRR